VTRLLNASAGNFIEFQRAVNGEMSSSVARRTRKFGEFMRGTLKFAEKFSKLNFGGKG
jgi:hypothetical protein